MTIVGPLRLGTSSPVTLTVKLYFGGGFCIVISIWVVTDNLRAVVAVRTKIVG